MDESDPDTDLPNIVHAFQTAERARKEYPELDWLHLVGLIHDMGKVRCLYSWRNALVLFYFVIVLFTSCLGNGILRRTAMGSCG